MNFAISFKKFLIVVLAGLALTACATQKKTGQMRDALSKGDQVVTAGGIHGKISRAEDTYVVLKMDDGAKIKFDRNAIARLASSQAEEVSQPLNS
mgnify:CR=1 FL=1